MPNELRIERISGNAYTRVTEKVRPASTPTADAGANVDQRKVTRAASEVSDQNEFIVIRR